MACLTGFTVAFPSGIASIGDVNVTAKADGPRIQQLRNAGGWTQEEISKMKFLDRSGGKESFTISKRTVENLEHGASVGIEFLQALAELFKVPVSDLIHDPVRYYLKPDVGDRLKSQLEAACDQNFSGEGALGFHPGRTFVPIFAHTGEAAKTANWVKTTLEQLCRPDTRLESPQHRVLLGNYGEGKTYSSWHLSLELAKVFSDRPKPGKSSAKAAGLLAKRPIIPLIFPLRKIAASDDETPPWDQVCHYFQKRFPELKFDGRLRCEDLNIEYDVLLILDALDELPANQQKTLDHFKSLREAAARFNRLSLLVSTRTAMFPGGTNELEEVFPGFTPAWLCPWDDANWKELLQQCDNPPFRLFSGRWAEFHKKVADRVDKDLTKRPLWCRLIIELRERVRSERINDAAALFSLYVDKFFEEPGQQIRETANLPGREFLLRAMELLGAERARLGSASGRGGPVTEPVLSQLLAREFRAAEDSQWNQILRHAARTRSLLHCDSVPSVAGYEYHFGHDSFEEYFQACYLARFIGHPPSSPLAKEDLERLLEIGKGALRKNDLLQFCRGLLQRDDNALGLSALLRKEPKMTFGSSKDATEMRQFLIKLWISHARAMGRPNLNGFHLEHLVLAGEDLHDCDFVGAFLNFANLSRCRLHGADFSSAKCRETQFTGAICQQPATWNGADLTDSVGLPKACKP